MNRKWELFRCERVFIILFVDVANGIGMITIVLYIVMMPNGGDSVKGEEKNAVYCFQ